MAAKKLPISDFSREHPQTVTLCGGYVAMLTSTHRNEWCEFVRTTPEWARLSEVEDLIDWTLNATETATSKSEYLQLTSESRELTAKLYAIGKLWVQELYQREASETEAS